MSKAINNLDPSVFWRDNLKPLLDEKLSRQKTLGSRLAYKQYQNLFEKIKIKFENNPS